MTILKKPLFAIGFIFVIAVTIYFFSPIIGHPYDLSCRSRWCSYIFASGINKIYLSDTDYLPLFNYVLYLYAQIQGNLKEITLHIYKLKLVTLFFEAGSTLILFYLLDKKYKDSYKALLFSLLYFCNLSILYNNLIWAQVDGIFTFFVFSSVISAYYKRYFLSVLCFIAAVNFKIQAIIFMPLLILLNFPIIKEAGYKKIILVILTAITIQTLIVLPFILNNQMAKLMHVVTGSVGRFPFISLHAYNFWHLILREDLRATPDNIIFAGLQYMRWGQILFFISGFAALFPLAKQNLLYLLKKQPFEVLESKVLITAALIPLLFFFFNTQMHERYTHSAFVFLTAYALLYKRPIPFIIASAAYFLNMEDVFQFLKLNSYNTLIFTPIFISALYGSCILLLFIDLYFYKRELPYTQQLTTLLSVKQHN